MKLTILHNDFDDCLLYVDGKQYHDIDYRWAECILWLKDIIGTHVTIEIKYFNNHRSEFPEMIF